jgi:hypothetical protein
MSAAWGRKFGAFFVTWLSLTVAGMLFTDRWNPLMMFLFGYTGFLLAVEYSNPQGPRPTNHRRLRWISMGGFVAFVYISFSWGQSVLTTMTG